MKLAGKFAMLVVLAAAAAFGGDKKPAASEPGGKSVDSGSFGVYVSGKRIGTETFNIEQFSDSSVAKAEFRTDDGNKSVQTAEMQLTTNGNLRRYTWNENSPGKATSVIEPQEQLLIQHISTGAADKPIDQQYILPPSTVVLDDYFFSQREVLLWRYMAGNCRTDEKGGCPLKAAQFGAIIPRQRTSMLVTVEYVGKETVSLHGRKQELSRFNLQTDSSQWALWLDANYKLVRVYVAAEALEAVRD